jgi:hypothetical protein
MMALRRKRPSSIEVVIIFLFLPSYSVEVTGSPPIGIGNVSDSHILATSARKFGLSVPPGLPHARPRGSSQYHQILIG